MNPKSAISGPVLIVGLAVTAATILLISLPFKECAPFFIIGAAILISLKFASYYNDIFNPVSLFTASWLGAYGLYLLYPYPPSIQPRLSSPAHILVIATFLCFLLGWSLAAIKVSKLPVNGQKIFTWSKGTTKVALFFLVILSFIAFAIQFQNAGWLEGLLNNPENYDNTFIQSGIVSKVFMLSQLAIAVLVMYMIHKKSSWFSILMVVFLVSLNLVSLKRQPFIFSVFLIIIIVNYYKHRFTLREGFIASVVMVGGLLLVVAFLYPVGLKGRHIEHAGIIANPIITQLYWYIAMGFRNIDVFIDKIGFWGYGFPKFTLWPIWAILFLKDTVGLTQGVGVDAAATRMFYEGWTAPTFIQPFYFDYGFIGTLIGIFVIGFGVTWWYHRLRCKITPFRVFTYALLANGLMLMFFRNKFTQPQTLIFAIQFFLLESVIIIMEKTISGCYHERVRHLKTSHLQ